MTKTTYLNVSEINDLQKKIMLYVQEWIREKKTPVPRQQIVLRMKQENIHGFTTINALDTLMRKGYIRRAVTFSNKTLFVQIRRVSDEYEDK